MLSRTLTRFGALPRQLSRQLSGHGHSAEEHAKEVATWRRYSVIMTGVTSFFIVYNVAFHSHDHQTDNLPYMKIRTRPFPWKECSDCEFFNGDCWKKCRAGDAAEEGGH